MNLHDLVKRKDPTVQVEGGSLEAGVLVRDDAKRRAVQVPAGARVHLRALHEFRCLAAFPADIGWVACLKPDAGSRKGARLRLELEEVAAEGRRHVLFETGLDARTPVRRVELCWPVWAGDTTGFHWTIENFGPETVWIDVGRFFNPRLTILPLLRGDGLEVGPGLNPQVLPSTNVRVRYVEKCPPQEWQNLYDKTGESANSATRELWPNYIVDDGTRLDGIADGSIDFVFTNHVVEHLMNPLGVLARWASKLRRGGFIAGVIPDARYCFDARQRWSRRDEWLQERALGATKIPRERYERWCRWTAGGTTTPESLIERDYSIHVHFYTTESFADLAGVLIEEGVVASAFYNTSPNNKDFGFVLFKAAG